MGFWAELKILVEQDLAIHMGRPVNNPNLWKCLVVDFLLIQLIIGPFTVCIWRGAWEFYDWVFGKIIDGVFYGGLLAFLLGFVLATVIALFFREIADFAKNGGTIQYLLVSRSYSMLRFLVALLYWKGVFDMLDAIYVKEWIVPHFAVVLAACALFIIGAFKSAAVTPPIGVNLDTQNDYITIATFYGTTREDSLQFRFVDALCTTTVEVISCIAFYGAWGCGKHWFGGRTNDDIKTIRDALIALIIAHGISVLVFISQFIYLYNHRRDKSRYHVQEWKDLCYALILILSLFATASYIRGWWELMDVTMNRLIPNYLAVENAVTFFLSFMIIILMGTASYNHFGVARESRRDKEGILLPFFYLTYYLRDRSEESAESTFTTHDATFAKLQKMLSSQENTKS